MTIAIKSVTVSPGTTATISVTTSESPSATAIGDLVVVIHGNDFYALSNMPTPTATGSPTVSAVTNGSADAGANQAHVKAYTYVANTAGAQIISVTETGTADEEKVLVAYVLSGADTTTPIDGGSSGAAGSFNTTAANPQVAPAVTPSGTDALLICHINTGAGDTAGPYSSPGGMSETYDSAITNLAYTGATQQLSASGSTGTKSFPSTVSARYASLSLAIKTAGGSGATVTFPQGVRIHP